MGLMSPKSQKRLSKLSRIRHLTSLALVSFISLWYILALRRHDSSENSVGVNLRRKYASLLRSIGNVPSLEGDVMTVRREFNPCSLLLFGKQECESQACLWSAALQKNIDFEFRPLQFASNVMRTCPNPAGGQSTAAMGGHLHGGQHGMMSYIITYQTPHEMLKKCILKIFLDARYTESAELIVVEDASKEQTAPIRHMLDALNLAFGFQTKYVTSAVNLGFAGANNKGVSVAEGEYVAIINSDALLVPGWSRSTVATLEIYPDVAYVGSHLVGDNDIVTDAGGCVWNDGSPEIIGRWLTELQPDLSYMRPVDYSSAAAVATRKDVFLSVGGFDTAYGKGYFEDTDLSFKLRKQGHRVVFQPMSLAFHQEGTSLGDDTSKAKQELMARSQKVFLDRWGAEIKKKHCPASTRDKYAAVHRHRKFNVLFLDNNLPEIDRDSGSIRADFIIQILIEMGVQVHVYPAEWHHPRYEQRARFLGANVFSKWDTDENVWGTGSNCKYNAVFVAKRDNFLKFYQKLRDKNCLDKVIYDTVDLHFLREIRQYASSGKPWQEVGSGLETVAKFLREPSHMLTEQEQTIQENMKKEFKLMRSAKVSLLVSEAEREILMHVRPPVTTYRVSNIYDFRQKQFTTLPWEDRSGCIFVGNMNHPPNAEAVSVFLTTVLPKLFELKWKGKQGFKFHVVASNIIPDSLKKLLTEHKTVVQLHSNLTPEQLRHLYASVVLSVAPLQSGAGVKGKVAEAVLMGVPLVGSPVALESMHLKMDTDVFLASSASDFARKMHILMTDQAKWESMRTGAWETLEQYFSRDLAKSELKKVLSHFVETPDIENINPSCV